MSPKYVDRSQRKKTIALAALPLFARGFESTSIDQIAKAADIGKGTIYEYFDNKQEIFAAAIEGWIEQGVTETSKLLKSVKDPVKRLEAFIEKTITLYNPKDHLIVGIFSTIQQQTISKDGAFYNNRQLISRLSHRTMAIITDILLDGIAKGVFKPEIARDVEILSRNMLSYLDGISVWHALMPDGEFDYQRHIDYFLSIFLKMILVSEPVTLTPHPLRSTL